MKRVARAPSTIPAFIERGDDEVKVTISYYVIPGCRGHRDKYGCPEEPDSPAEIEIIDAKDEAGNEHELTDAEIDKIENKIWDKLADQPDPPDPPDWSEDR